MANNINWGKIYESTAWGSGVTDNNISWGKSYADLAGGGGTPFTGLLDTYSGAAAAYSLRQLSSTYSGDAIVVRRASDNTTQNIGFVNNELDTASLESFCSGTDGFVTTWYDQSGNGNDAAQATAADQPKIVASGSTITEGAKPSLEFDDITQGFDFTTALNYSLGFSFVVLNPKTDATWSVFTDGSKVVPIAQQGSGSSNSFGYDLVNLWNNSSLLGSTRGDVYTSTTNQNNLLSIEMDTLGSNITRLFDRGGFVFGGTSQELVIYTSDQSTNRTGIETNINTHYSIY